MAYVFYKALMASEDVKSLLTSVKFQSSGTDAAVSDGSFVVLGNMATDATYSATGKSRNVYLATAPAAVSDSVVVVDIAGVSEGTIAGNDYKIGAKLFDLVAPAGIPARARKFMVGDKFWLGSSNFGSATPTVGQFATLTAGATTLTPAAVQGNNFAVKIQDSMSFTTGQVANGSLYLCEVVAL